MGLQKNKLNNISQQSAGHEVEITVYTDPLCCWSWAFHPTLIKMKEDLGNKAGWEFKMGGLIPSWNNYHDEVNSVSRPAQMGPVWMHAGQIANMPIHHLVWMTDPPASSYPACVAVKSAQLQRPEYGETFLQLLRKACMEEGKNISRQSVIFDIAEKSAARMPGFDMRTFRDDYEGGNGMEAFRSDLEQVRFYNINRFPTLIIKSGDGKAIMISGYHHYAEILKAIETLVPGVAVQQ